VFDQAVEEEPAGLAGRGVDVAVAPPGAPSNVNVRVAVSVLVDEVSTAV